MNDAEVQRFLQSAVAGGAALVEGRFRDSISAGESRPTFLWPYARSKSRILLVA